jgi:hypothetical protein
MAQLVGGGEEVSLQHFSKECSVEPQVLYQVSNSPSRYHFFINKDRDIAWIYDDEKDIHYFYG